MVETGKVSGGGNIQAEAKTPTYPQMLTRSQVDSAYQVTSKRGGRNLIGQRHLSHRPHYLRAPRLDKCTLLPFPVSKCQREEVPAIPNVVPHSKMGQKQQQDTVTWMVKEGQQRNLFRGPNKSHDPVLCHKHIIRPLEWCWRTTQKWSNNWHTFSYLRIIPVSYTTRFVYMSKNIGCLIHNWPGMR